MTGKDPLVSIAGLDDGIVEREQRMPQPGGRQPAPGELVLLQSFLNTHFDLVSEWGADLLDTPQGLAAWLSNRGLIPRSPGQAAERLTPTAAAVRRAIAVREGLRELARQSRDPEFQPDEDQLAGLNAALQRVCTTPRLGADGVVLSPAGRDPVDRALELLVTIALLAMIDGRWRRLKACPGDHCGWVFYDHSRNSSGRWCSMAACGGRTKARAHYRRHRTRSDE
jgi:predicted RNA-binding Zn ribbon-like protein